MPELLQHHPLAAYIPRRLRLHLCQASVASDDSGDSGDSGDYDDYDDPGDSGEKSGAVRVEQIFGATMFADLTGFTRLCAALHRAGSGGAQQLASILDHSLGGLVDCVQDSGGDVLHFAGDAVVAVWCAPSPAQLRPSLERALRCALRAQLHLGGWVPYPDFTLHLRIGLSVGGLSLVDLRAGRHQRRYLAAGTAIRQVSVAESQAVPGTTVLTRVAARLLTLPDAARRLPGGAICLDIRCAHAYLDPPQPPRQHQRPDGDDYLSQLAKTEHDSLGREPVGVHDYVPAAVISRSAAGQTAWLSEHRTVTAVFLSYPTLDPDTAPHQDLLQQLASHAGQVTTRAGGSLDNLLVDRDGTTLVLAFGLPPQAHPDDALRAVWTALDLYAHASTLQLPCQVGIATGRALCGAFGSSSRRHYTFLGDTVNLAARLMAAAPAQVWCDESTTQAITGTIDLELVGQIALRGRSQPVVVSRALARTATNTRYRRLISPRGHQHSDAEATPLLVGREEQHDQLIAQAEALSLSASPLCVMLFDPGQGASLLLATVRDTLRTRGFDCYVGVATPLDIRAPYTALSEALALILGVFKQPAALAQARLLTLMGPLHPLANRVSLLGPALGLALPSNAVTDRLTAEPRRAATQDLLLVVTQARCRQQAAVLMVDDGQWLDDSSWSLLSSLRDTPGLLIIMTHNRPPPGSTTRLDRLLQRRPLLRLDLPPLAASQIIDLARHLLSTPQVDLPQLSTRLRDLIVSGSAGSPLFCETLINTLLSRQVVHIRDGRADLYATRSADALELPPTIQGAVTGRLDALPESAQLTLKVAAVIGRNFSLDALAAIHPFEQNRARLLDQLDTLVGMGMCAPTRSDHSYAFRHAVVHETCTQLLLPDQARALHTELAAWLEVQPALASTHHRLAHHHRLAGHAQQALGHLQQAGLAALALGANREAVDTLIECLALADRHSSTTQLSSTERATLLCGLGEAQHRLGEAQVSASSLRRALKALKINLPTGPLGWGTRLLTELAEQLLWRSGVARLLPITPATQTQTQTQTIASRAASWYSNVSYFRLNALQWLASALIAANLADRAHKPAVAGLAYVNLANVFGSLHLRRIERTYLALADLAPEPCVAVVAAWSRAVVELTRAAWQDAAATTDAGLSLGRSLGDRWAMVNGYILQGLVRELTGQLRPALTSFSAARGVSASGGGSEMTQSTYGQVFAVPTLLSLGDLKTAEELLGADSIKPGHGDPLTVIAWQGAMAGLRLRQSRLMEAADHARHFVDAVSAAHLTVFTYGALLSLSGQALLAAELAVAELAVAELAVAERGLSERANSGGTSPHDMARRLSMKDLVASRELATSLLRRGALIFPHFRPYARMLQGTAAWQAGKRARARRYWRRALAAAQALEMPAVAGRVHIEIARHLDATSADHRYHLDAAQCLLIPSGAAGDLALAQNPPVAATPIVPQSSATP